MKQDANIKQKNWTWFLFSLNGRINRKSYWIFNGIVFLGGIVLGSFTEISPDIESITKPQLMFMLWVFWPSIAVQVKRWHDLNKSGLWILINFIPLLGPIWAFIENGFFPGTIGENRFGPDPVEKEDR